jgi:hypothetical protein
MYPVSNCAEERCTITLVSLEIIDVMHARITVWMLNVYVYAVDTTWNNTLDFL